MLEENLNNTDDLGNSAAGRQQAAKAKELRFLADMIKVERQGRQLSQKELAQAAGITAVQICRIENAECRPSKRTLQKLSGPLGVPYPELLFSAGYSNLSGDYTLYKKDGSELKTDAIVENIYRVDSDFLDSFRDIDLYGTPENMEVLRLMLAAMRKEAIIKENSQEEANPVFALYRKTLLALKRYIVAALTPFLQIDLPAQRSNG